jgi:MFS family permease
VIWAACLFGGLAMALAAITPGIALFVPAVVLLAAASGIFLAVDWAFMTDVIPKISAGRYMGLSNVATASSTALAPAIGGVAIFIGTQLISYAAGPRLAQAIAIVLFMPPPPDRRRRLEGAVHRHGAPVRGSRCCSMPLQSRPMTTEGLACSPSPKRRDGPDGTPRRSVAGSGRDGSRRPRSARSMCSTSETSTR